MRVLLISPRFPWPPYTGDRLRATIWLDALTPYADVALAAPVGAVPAKAASLRFYPASRSLPRAIHAALTVLRRRLPLQSLLAAPYDWDGAIRTAQREHGAFDATIVLLSRTDPWVRNRIAPGRRVLDAVDSLKRNAAERASASSGFARWFWRGEERRLARSEKEMSLLYDRVIVVSEEETDAFGSPATAIGNGVRIAPLDVRAPRKFDFGFWGRLAYFANADAARWLIEEIWPRIRQLLPSATLVVGGADASRSLRRLAERGHVLLLSPVEQIDELARSIRVALIPLRYGSGQSSKVMEAAEAGCAIAATPHALRGLPQLAAHARAATTALSLAEEAVALLTNEELRQRSAAALRRAVESHHSREQTLAQLRKIIGVTA